MIPLYYTFNRRCQPIAEEKIRNLEKAARSPISCGYSEVLLRYGTGVIAGGITILNPDGVLDASEESREHLAECETFPENIDESFLKSGILLAVGHEGVEFWWHKSFGRGLLILDSEMHAAFWCPYGFHDPRYGYNDDGVFIGRYGHLTFDSGLDRKWRQAVQAGNNLARVESVVSQFMKQWFAPGDIIVGDLGTTGATIIYLSGLKGLISVTHQSHSVALDMISVDYDPTHDPAVMKMLGPLKDAGYTLYE